MRDWDVRAELTRTLDAQHAGEDYLIVPEMGLCCGRTRVDVAVLNGSLHGYEIKSAHDSVARLPGQQKLYSSVLDYCTLVTAERHLAHAEALLPEAWGIWVATPAGDGAIELEVRKTAAYNKDVDSYRLTQMLWREELAEELRARQLWRGLSTKPLRSLWLTLADAMPVAELRQVVRDRIKLRGDWRAAPTQW
jgi:hypothetical protein